MNYELDGDRLVREMRLQFAIGALELKWYHIASPIRIYLNQMDWSYPLVPDKIAIELDYMELSSVWLINFNRWQLN